MGIIYTLIKRDAPEAYNLGKGRGWPEVFGRHFGFLGFGCNFDDPFRIDGSQDFSKIINPPSYGKNTNEIIASISKWAGNSEVFLINYWEEIESYQDGDYEEYEDWREVFEEEFKDLRPFLPCSLLDYKITGNVYAKVS